MICSFEHTTIDISHRTVGLHKDFGREICFKFDNSPTRVTSFFRGHPIRNVMDLDSLPGFRDVSK